MAWNGSNGASTPRPTTPANSGLSPVIKGAIAGFIVVVVAIAAFLFLTRSAPEASVEEPEAKPTQIADKGDQVKKSAPLEEPEEDPDAAKKRYYAERRAKLKKMTPEERLNFLFEEAKARPIDLTPSTNQAFRTGTEQVMSWIFNCELGRLPPPLPPIPLHDRAHLAEILIADNPVFETDSENARQAKEAVKIAKEELIKYIKEGGEPDDFLDYYHGQLKLAHEEWMSSKRAIIESIKNDDPLIAKEFVEQVNKGLIEKGIKPVTVPKGLQQRLDAADNY